MPGKLLAYFLLLGALWAAWHYGRDFYADYAISKKLGSPTTQTTCSFPASELQLTGEAAHWHHDGRDFTLANASKVPPENQIILLVDEIGETIWTSLPPAAATRLTARYNIPANGCREKTPPPAAASEHE